jgi:hypothetical protein
MFIDLENDSIPDELLDEKMSGFALDPNDSIKFNFNFTPMEVKTYYLIFTAIYTQDEDTLNNKKFLSINVSHRPGSIIINEIMFAPQNDEPEWVEIYNPSSDTLNLKNWMISDASSKVVLTEDDFPLEPSSYLVISEDSSILNFYNIPSRILTVRLPSLNNTGDAVVIYDHTNVKIDSVFYSGSWGRGGYSLERIEVEGSSTDSTNWSIPTGSIRATPGMENSVKPLPYDLKLQSIYLQKPYFRHNEVIKLIAVVGNAGINPVSNFTLKTYLDVDQDSTLNGDPLISKFNFSGTIYKRDSARVELQISNLPSGNNQIILYIDFQPDMNLDNNIAVIHLRVSYPERAVVINEIMFAPVGDEPEWVEIYNLNSQRINLKNWRIADALSDVPVARDDFFLEPLNYLVIAKDSSIFDFYNIPSKVIISKFPSLNNDMDAVIIYDETGMMIDSVFYFGNWGRSGFSIERVEFEEGSLDPLNWSIPADSIRATPGRENSVKPLQYDLTISSIYLSETSLKFGQPLEITVVVKNSGINVVSDFSIEIYLDIDFDSTLSENDPLLASGGFKGSLEKRDSTAIKLRIPELPSGYTQLIIYLKFSRDMRSMDNMALISLKVGYPENAVVINEIMFEPLKGFSEYIEIYNRSELDVNLNDWRIGDMRNFNIISDSNFILKPGEFLVISSDSSIFNYLDRSGDRDIKLVILNRDLGLNNNFDDVILSDPIGGIIDSVRYFSGWHSPIVPDTKGRSLERINPELPSNDGRSWSTSTDRTGGTPGRINSIFTELNSQPQEPNISISPNPFSPDGDGFEDFCIISYTLPFDEALISARIFDSSGRPVRTLANNEYSGKNGNLTWDGLGDDGRRLRIGIYIILFEARSDDGRRFQSKTVVVLAGRM